MTYFIADPHFFARQIIKWGPRRWAMSLKERDNFDRCCGKDDIALLDISPQSGIVMVDQIIQQINAKVGQEDRLVLLGDVVTANDSKQARKRTIDILSRIDCKDVHLVWGNHDGLVPNIGVDLDGYDGIPQGRSDFRTAVADLYRSTHDSVMVHSNSIKVWCSHYPCVSWPDASKTGFPGHAKPHRTIAVHAYGHVHGKFNNDCPVAWKERWAAVDVGVDGHRDWPLSASELLTICRPMVSEQMRHAAG